MAGVGGVSIIGRERVRRCTRPCPDRPGRTVAGAVRRRIDADRYPGGEAGKQVVAVPGSGGDAHGLIRACRIGSGDIPKGSVGGG